MPSHLELFLPGGNAVVDSFAVLAFFCTGGSVAVPAGFSSDFFLGHYLTGLGSGVGRVGIGH